MFENSGSEKRAARVLDFDFPNLGRMGASLCDRRSSTSSHQENRQGGYFYGDDDMDDDPSDGSGIQNGAKGSGYFHGWGPYMVSRYAFITSGLVNGP